MGNRVLISFQEPFTDKEHLILEQKRIKANRDKISVYPETEA